MIRSKMRSLQKAEWQRRRRKERARKTSVHFRSVRVYKKLFGVNQGGQLVNMTDEINAYLIERLKDPNRHREHGENTSLISPVSPLMNFHLKEPTWNDIQSERRSARSGSTSGPNGVPYIVYKRCLQLLWSLWKLSKIAWRRGKITCQWRHSEGSWIPKEEGVKRISEFRSISLLDVEGNICFLNRRLSDYLLKNEYIATALEKWVVPRMTGWIEHTGVVSKLLKDVKKDKGDMMSNGWTLRMHSGQSRIAWLKTPSNTIMSLS